MIGALVENLGRHVGLRWAWALVILFRGLWEFGHSGESHGKGKDMKWKLGFCSGLWGGRIRRTSQTHNLSYDDYGCKHIPLAFCNIPV